MYRVCNDLEDFPENPIVLHPSIHSPGTAPVIQPLNDRDLETACLKKEKGSKNSYSLYLFMLEAQCHVTQNNQ